jgi:hypothetical protein
MDETEGPGARQRELAHYQARLLQRLLYTRFVIGELTLSSASAFSFSHPAILSPAIKSSILGSFCSLLLGIIGSYVMSASATKYYFKVTAVNSGGASAATSQASAKTQ